MYKKFNLKFKIFSIFILAYGLLFYISAIDKNSRIEFILNEEIQNLQTHYKLIKNYFFIDATSIKAVLQKDIKVKQILSKAQSASKAEREILREELFKHLSPLYARISKRGILQFHFVFSDNVTFLRMHKRDKHGDDLSGIRHSFVYANKEQKDIWGFEQGRTTHGFRYVYPLYDEHNHHIGAVETSLSADYIQNKLIKISKLHSHFLVNKKIFDTKSWDLDSVSTNYIPSIENKDYLFSVIGDGYTDKKYKTEMEFLLPFKDSIATKIALKKAFTIHHNIDSTTNVATFMPIKNIKDKEVIAYLVSYTNNNNIYEIDFHFKIFIVSMFFIFGFLSYFIYVNLKRKDELRVYEKIISVTSSHMSYIDRNYIYQAVNERYLKVHQKKREEIIGHSVLELFGEDMFYTKLKEKLDVCLGGEEVNYSAWFNSPLSGRIYMKVSYYPYINRDNEVSGIVVSSNDITELIQIQEKLKELANRDQLTDLYNRRYFYDVVQNIISLAKRENKELSVLMIDIDKFKDINDTYGHANGDKVIKSLAATLLNHTRDSDIVARIGGEEFVILLTNTSKDTAFKVANKIREFTQEDSLKIDDKTEINFTISIGVDSVNIQDEKSIDEALSRSDKALYKAKDSGRNKVC